MSFYALNHNSGRQIKLLILPQTLQIQIKPDTSNMESDCFHFSICFLSVPNSFCQLPFPGVLYYFALGIYKIIDTQLPFNWHFYNPAGVAHQPTKTLCYLFPLFFWYSGVFPILRGKILNWFYVVQLNQSQSNAAFHSGINRVCRRTNKNVATV